LRSTKDIFPSSQGDAGTISLPERAEIPDSLKWNPGIFFRDLRAWDRERRAIAKELPRLEKLRGHLGTGPEAARRGLDAIFEVRLRLERLSAYASRLSDTDMRQSRYHALTDASEKLFTDFLSATSWAEPELLSLPEGRLAGLAASPALGDYDRYLGELIRQRKHVLSGPEESILAGASALGMVSYNTYKTYTNSDLEFPTIQDQEGRSVVLSPAMYSRYRQSPHREERRLVFEAFWGAHKKVRNTFAQMLAGQISYYDFSAKARRYPDALSSALEPNQIPPSFYGRLVSSVREHMGAFHGYLRLRGKLLGIEGEQSYYDIYPMPVARGQRTYTIERSRALIQSALRPLGRDYGRMLSEAMAEGSGWLDVLPNKGKRSGAYSSSVYGYHPMVLLNFNSDFDSLSTTAHELGHALHSAYSNDSQPYPKSEYSLFIAEVASIFNETLLIEHLLGKERDPSERRFLLAAYLDSFRGTVFRQTLFAEFELAIYRRVAARKALTADSLSSLYLKLLRDYHGHGSGVMRIDPLYGIEWAYIPHFYYHFYVYQYVSGFIAATALAERVLSRGAPAARQYTDALLCAGSSMDPLEILRRAGVDMMSPGPYRQAIRKFAARVRELAALGKPTGAGGRS
jgi:oligoendopeptidase F